MRDDYPAGDRRTSRCVVRVFTGSQGRTSAISPEELSGTLRADGYAGFDQMYEAGRIQEAACWAHVRRKFYDLESCAPNPPLQLKLWNASRGCMPLRKKSEDIYQTGGVAGWRHASARPHAGIAETMVRGDAQGTFRENPIRLWPFVNCARTVGSTAALRVMTAAVEIDMMQQNERCGSTALGRKNFLFAGSDRRWRERRG